MWIVHPDGKIDIIAFDERWSSRRNAEEATLSALWHGKVCGYDNVMRKQESGKYKEDPKREYVGTSKGMDGPMLRKVCE